MAFLAVGSGISENNSEQPNIVEGLENRMRKNATIDKDGFTRKNAKDNLENRALVKLCEDGMAPTFEEVDLNSCGSSNASTDDAMVSTDELHTKSDDDSTPAHIDVLVQEKITDSDSLASTSSPKLVRSVSYGSSASGKSTPKQKISWGQVNDIPVPEPIPNEQDENHVSRNQPSFVRANSLPNPTKQRYVWEVWPVAGSLVRVNKAQRDEAEIPGGETEVQKTEVDFLDEKTPPENGAATIVGESKKHRPPPLTISPSEKNETTSISSLRRVTSRSSLASVGNKILLSMPNEIKKKPEDNPLRCVVVVLFALCLGMVLTAHILYNQHIGEVRIFERVRLEEAHRNLMVYGPNNSLIITGQLGVQMPHDLHSYSCLPTSVKNDNVKCLEWKNRVKLEMMKEERDGVTCHRVMWTALNKENFPIDCWPVGPLNGHWYGGGESLVSKWPLDNGRIKMSPFVTGDEDQTEWGNVIRKFFINSQGISITIEDDTPLSVSLNDQANEDDGHRGLCFRASFDDFPYYYHRYSLPVLNYSVCTDGNVKQVYESQLVKSFWDGHQDSDMEVLQRLLHLPLWQVPGAGEGMSYTPQIIKDYLVGLIGRGKTRPNSNIQRGYLLLDYHWQKNMGDFSFNKEKFSNIQAVQNLVRDSGLRLALTINPFVSVDSENFKEGVKEGLFVMERNSSKEKNIPALTWFKDVPVAALLDITNNKTVAWLKTKLSALIAEDASDAVFFLDTGNTFHTPHYFTFTQPLPNPDLYKEHFIKHCMDVVKVIGVSGASSKRPKAPAFVWMTPLESSWESLQSIVPNVLNLGVIGYPFINPGPIGGRPSNSSHNPDVELFTRWWQLSTFLPQLHFLTPPAAYREDGIAPVAKKLKDIKDTIVNPLLLKYAGEAMEKSLPLIRPLWMFNPTDNLCQTIHDQFMIGDKILVAPVLNPGQRRRSVYLPPTVDGPGVWKRGTDGKYYEGGRWLNSSVVELDEVLYFERLANHIRPGHL